MRCKRCGNPTNSPSYNRRLCDNCNPNCRDWSKITLREFYGNLPKYQANARLRQLSRAIYKKELSDEKCLNCGYTHHTEICHIKAIQSFDKETPISVVNDISNLTCLCPNCHYELDHNILKPEKIGEARVELAPLLHGNWLMGPG